MNKFVKQTSTNDRLKSILLTFDSKELADYFSFIDSFKALLEFCSENDFEKMKEFFAKENYLALFDATKNALMEKLDKDIDYIYEYIEEEKSKVAA